MRATVVSLLPYRVGPENKPGLFPGEYTVPAAKGDELGILIVVDGQRGVYLDHDRGSELMVVAGEKIAKSVVEDYVLSQPGQDQEAGPGMFWVMEAFTESQIKQRFPEKILGAAKMQKEWWKRLVRLADDVWQTSHIIAQIGDLDRVACRELGLKRDWLDDSPDTIIRCPVCTTLISKSAIVCFACHVVLNAEEYKKFSFAGTVGGTAGNPVQPVNTK